MRSQHLTFGAETRAQLHIEASGRQRVAHRARRRPTGQGCIGPGHTRERFQQRGVPHLRISVGGEAVQIKGVGAQHQLRNQGPRIAESEGQRDGAGLERQPVQAGERRRPVARQLRRQRAKGWWRATDQVARLQRVAFHRNEMQPARSSRVVAPGLPGRQEVDTQPEAGLDDHELRASSPARRQIVAAQEHVPGLTQRTAAAGVYIAVTAREGRAPAVELQRF